MDGRRFDELTRQVVQRAASRRGLLRGSLATTLSGLAAGLRPLSSAAVANDPRCPGGVTIIGNKKCNLIPCGSTAVCGGSTGACAQTVSGARDCVPLGGILSECPVTDECDRDGDCGTGQVCVRVGACCCPQGTPNRRRCKRRNKCLTACTE
jgi:hypothetical protein